MKKQQRHDLQWILLLLNIICATILLLIPLNLIADSDTSIQGANVNPQTTNLDYWPPVIAQLEALYTKDPNNQQTILALTNAYNNYGVLLANNKQWTDAVSYIQQALKISPDNTAIKNNLSNVYYEQGKDMFLNQRDLNTYTAQNAAQLANLALSLNPNNVHAYLLLGDIEYMSQDMTAAERNWKKAAQLVPNNAEVQRRLAQIQRETVAETDMNSVFNSRFNIRIDSSIAANPNFDINKILDNAYNNVAPDFGFVPLSKVPVVVYNRQEYQDTMIDAPGWSEAAYDGKIRLAIKPEQKDFRQLNSDVIHEYTHVIVGALTNNNCPRWFNEGIAKYEEYLHGVPPRIYMLGIAYNTNQLISWDNIDAAFLSPQSETAMLAYQQSFSFVYYIAKMYGMPKIVATLKTLGQGVDFPTAIQQVYSLPLSRLEQNWRVWLTDFITNWANIPATSGVDYD